MLHFYSQIFVHFMRFLNDNTNKLEIFFSLVKSLKELLENILIYFNFLWI